MTLPSRSPYDDPRPLDGARPRRRVPARIAMLVGLVLLVVVITSTSSTRLWWAHRVHDMTGGSRTGGYFFGLAVGLLPLFGVALGTVRVTGPRRVFRMLLLGGAGFLATYLLAPSPARWLVDRAGTHTIDQLAPGYLAGVFTGAMVWLALVLLALLRIRSWWRRVTGRFREQPAADDRTHPRVIDV